MKGEELDRRAAPVLGAGRGKVCECYSTKCIK